MHRQNTHPSAFPTRVVTSAMTHPLFLFPFLLAFSAAAASSSFQCPTAHRDSLLRLKQHLVDISFLSWDPDTDCCGWPGVSCNGADGEGVTSLDLSNHGISGNLSYSDLFTLTSLRSLNLSNNLFHGSTIPSPGFERLGNLTYLNLSNSGFVGQVPIGIARLHNLVTLDLSSFFLDQLPNASLQLRNPTFEVLIADLKSLQRLYLDGVNMSATGAGWAKAVAIAVPGLRELSLAGCSITGPIDDSFAKLRMMSRLVLKHNNLSCPVPDFFAEFTSINVLSLSDCNLNGIFPKRVLRMKSLRVIDVAYNPMLSGELPDFVPGSDLQNLVLTHTNFSGMIPESIDKLQNLSTLQLAWCQFHGVVPHSVTSLKHLVHLDLSMNNFSGMFPSFVEWPMIYEVILAHNNFLGSLPPYGYMGLHNLIKIDLQNNSISGQIPASLFSLPSLQQLQLSHNLLSGNLMEFTNASYGLQVLDVSGNHVLGQIPKSLFNLSGLKVLKLASNKLSGTMQLDWISGLANLSTLDLSNNRLSVVDGGGHYSFNLYPNITTLTLVSCNLTKLPSFLRYQVGVRSLDLSDNHITGFIPDWIWNVGNLSLNYLNLSHNLFIGMNKHLLNLSSIPLNILDLHSNILQGTLPLLPPGISVLDFSQNNLSSFISSTFLSYLNFSTFLSLSNNSLTGEIPSSICQASYLLVLDLSDNSLEGSIPPCLLAGENRLRMLNLRGNKFDGSVPQNISKGCVLQSIKLGSNKLAGRLPQTLVNCRRLEVLDVGNNQLRDTVPYWLGILPHLKVLVLRSNGFYGPIGNSTICNSSGGSFPMLQIFDISSNSFSGYIPVQCLRNLNALMVYPEYASQPLGFSYLDFEKTQSYYLETVMVTYKGLELTFVKILSTFTILDLSNNRLNGSIPSDIGKLKLLKGLNLSKNAITGIIPDEMANLGQLESLDLSSNQLSGVIPQGMTSLNSLSSLNLSYNNLFGRIPQSGQFSTFSNTSFLGNKDLCGSPLSHLCSAVDDLAPPAQKVPVLRSPMSLNYQFILCGLGFGVGFAIAVVPLMVWSKGKRWCDKQIDKLSWLCDSRTSKRVGTEESGGSDASGELEEPEEPELKFCLFHTRLEFIGETQRNRIRHAECSCNVAGCGYYLID